MKVAQSGMLAWFNGHATLNGWVFIGDGRHEGPRDALKAVLIHIARQQGIELVAVPVAPVEPAMSERFDLDSEREALDVIAMARWRESGDAA